MTDFELPDDLSQWPADPFDILGISWPTDAMTIKRAYNLLLRRFKPELFPDHFQRLRAAYEQAQLREERGRRFHDQVEFDDELPAAVRPAAQPPVPKPPISDVYPPAPVNKPRPRAVDVEQVAWQAARAGRPEEGYLQLAAWVEQPAGASIAPRWEAFARLYWLRVVFPELDAQRSSSEWLARGLTATNCAPQLLELYRREIDRDPTEAFQPRLEALLPPAPASAIFQLLEMRWLAAQRLERTEVIPQDLALLRPKLSFDAEVVWFRLLVLAIEHGALTERPGFDALDPYFEEIEEATHIHQVLDRDLERLDAIRAMAVDWPELQRRGVPASWLNVLRQGWFLTDDAHWPLVENLAAEFALRPSESLHALDLLYGFNRPVGRRVLELLEQYRQRRGSEPPSFEQAARGVRAHSFFRPDDIEDYDKFHIDLLTFCLQEDVHPVHAAQIAASSGVRLSGASDNLIDRVARDELLWSAYATWRAFWK